jgi:hypothetical protein
MQLQDRAGSRTAEEPARADPLVKALAELYRAYQKLSIYPSGHPAIPRAVDAALECFEAALAEREEAVVLGVGRDHLIGEAGRITEASGLLRSLASLLHDIDVAAIELRRGLDRMELERFIRTVDRARREKFKGEAVARAIQDDGLRHIDLLPIDYRALAFEDGAHADRDASEDRDLWEHVSTGLLGLAAAESPKEMADDVARRIDQHEGAGIGSLRKELQRLTSKLRNVRTAQRQDVYRRMASFLAALSPGLRHDLLRVDPRQPADSISLVTELADELPVTDLVAALRDVDRCGGRPPEELVTLLNKLVRVASERPPVASFLEETLERWEVSPEVLDWGPIDMRGALEEVFQRRSQEEYNPAQYQDLLHTLARRNLSGRAIDSLSIYGAPTDDDEVRIHAAEIAVQLLQRPDGDEQRPALFGRVTDAAELLVERGPLPVLHAAAIAARAHAVLKRDSEDTRRAAKGFLTDLGGRRCLERLLTRVQSDPTTVSDAVGLLDVGGPLATDLVLDFLRDCSHPETCESLERYVLQRSRKEIADLVEGRAGRGRSSVDPLLPILAKLAPVDGVPLLERLSRHEDSRVRRDVLPLLCRRDLRPGATERHLRRALGDKSPRVVAAAIRIAGSQDVAEMTTLLGDFVAGRIGSGAAAESQQERACEALLRKGDAGRRELAGALRALSWGLRLERLQRSELIVRMLERLEPDHPSVADSVRAWRRSPARLLLALAPRRRATDPGSSNTP